MKEDALNVLYNYRIKDKDLKYLQFKVGERVNLMIPDKVNDKDSLVQIAPLAEVIVGGVADKDMLAAAKNLKAYVVPYAGVPRANQEIFREKPNIMLVNSHWGTEVVAEHALALALAATKMLVPRDMELRDNDWTTRYSDMDRDTPLLKGKTAGIYGYGRIGKAVARRLIAIGMKVQAIKYIPTKEEIEQSKKDGLEFLGGKEDLPKLLKNSDLLVVTVPSTDETRGAIGKAQLDMMRPAAYIVNLSRGNVIEEEPFYDALKRGRIAGAAIDAWYNYPEREGPYKNVPPSKFPFGKLRNVVMSPHRASHGEGREIMRLNSVAEALKAISDGKRPESVVDKKKGY